MIECAPHRAGLRTTRHVGESTISQTMVLQAGSPRIDFRSVVDWRESHRLLKVAFPVDVRSATAGYDVGFGYVERPTHENTSWDAAQFEVPAHRFADLSEPGYGVALLNDGKHGHDVHGSTLRLTLLRAPTAPDPQADRGVHEFTYALLPHPGDLVQARVGDQAEAFDIPLRTVTTAPRGGDLPPTGSLLHMTGDAQVAVTAVKKSERGGALVVRVCEVAGGRGTVHITAPARATEAARCDLLERPRTPLPLDAAHATELALRPFELATLRFELR
jgi:alpha-mannosidase